MKPVVPRRVRNLCVRISESEDEELTYERGAGWWVGFDRVRGTVCKEALRFCLLRVDSFCDGDDYQIYELNEEGRALVDDASYEPEILKHIGTDEEAK